MSLNTEYDLKVDGVKVPLGTKVTYDHTGLASNTEHTYQIAIKDTDNWSTEVKIKTLSLPPPPPPVIIPQNIRIAASTESSIQIVWDEVSPITEYDLEVDGVVVSVGADESYHHTGLSSGSKHKYRVRIKDGEWSPVLIVKTSSNTSSSKGSNSKNSNNDNNNDIEYDKVEVYFGNKRNFIYENQLIGNAKVNILNKIFLCNFGEDYYLGIRAWKDNKLKVETEYKLNLTPENKLIFNKSDDKVKNINFEIKETMIQGTGEKVFYVNDLENITLSKYIIDNGYVVSIDHIKMKSNKNSRYNISEDYNIGKIQ